MDNLQQARAVRKITKGYLLIFLAINIWTIDILPDWAGYLIIISALPVLAKREKSVMLIKPLGIALAVYSLIWWILGIFGGTVNITAVNIIFTVLKMYFDFQLITNIAQLAADDVKKRKILILRNAMMILHTCAAVLGILSKTVYAAAAVIVVYLIMWLWIFIELRRIAKSLENAYRREKLNALGEAKELKTDNKTDTEENADAL